MSEPLSDEELQEMRERNRSLDAYLIETLPAPRVPVVDTRLFSGASNATNDIDALLAEVDRLREEVERQKGLNITVNELASVRKAQAEAKVAAMRPIVAAVAAGGVADLLSKDGVERCIWTPRPAREIIAQARAQLAKEASE